MSERAEEFVVGQFVKIYIGKEWRKGMIERIRKERCDQPIRVSLTKTGHYFNVGTKDIRMDTIFTQSLSQEFSEEMQPTEAIYALYMSPSYKNVNVYLLLTHVHFYVCV